MYAAALPTCLYVVISFVFVFIFSIRREMRFRVLPQHQRMRKERLVSVRLLHQHRIGLRIPVERIAVPSNERRQLQQRTPVDIQRCPPKKRFAKYRRPQRNDRLQAMKMESLAASRRLVVCRWPSQNQWIRLLDQQYLFRVYRIVIPVHYRINPIRGHDQEIQVQ